MAVITTLHTHHFHCSDKNVADLKRTISGNKVTPKYIPSSVNPNPINPISAKSKNDLPDLDSFSLVSDLYTNVIDNSQFMVSPAAKPNAVDIIMDHVLPISAGESNQW